MRDRRWLRRVAGAIALSLALMATDVSPASGHLCSCCPNPGERGQVQVNVPAEDLAQVSFAPVAEFYTTEAYPDDVQGVAGELEAPIAASLTQKGRQWTLVLTDKQGKRGALVLTVPARGEYFRVDPRDGRESSGGGPLLYKELRLQGPVWGNGIFARGIVAGRTTFRLVLQGRGGSCPFIEEYTHWHLQVTGPAASYAFFGDLKKQS